jgi:hypothetical protein
MKYVVEMRLRHSDVDGGIHRHIETDGKDL